MHTHEVYMNNLANLNGSDVNKGIESDGVGGNVLTGAGIDFYRLLLIRQALQCQIKGFKLSSKLPQGTTLARKHLGLRGNKHSLLSQVEDIIARIQNERAASTN